MLFDENTHMRLWPLSLVVGVCVGRDVWLGPFLSKQTRPSWVSQ